MEMMEVGKRLQTSSSKIGDKLAFLNISQVNNNPPFSKKTYQKFHRMVNLLSEGRQIRSFDGYKARPYEYPFMAAFKVYKDYDKRTSGCTAVQISPRHLLTAAHCVIQKIHYWQKYCEAGKEREYFIFWGIPPEYFYIFVGSICTHPELCPQTSMFKAKEGDSGGPLIRTNEEGKHILVGITSSMKPHCEVSTERIYDRDNFFADVRAYVHWICEVT
ncbi:trypsin, partial [Teladorsagia circumcincta]